MGVLISLLFWIFIIYLIVNISRSSERKPKSKRKPYLGYHTPIIARNIKNNCDSYIPPYHSFEFYLNHEDSIKQMFAEQVWGKEFECAKEITPYSNSDLQILPSEGFITNKKVVRAGSKKTTSHKENLFYKELLNRQEWKSKRKEILARDYNTCQWCNNIIKLNSLLYLDSIVDDSNMVNIIKGMFCQRDKIIAEQRSFTNIGNCKLISSTFIDSENIYVHKYETCKTFFDYEWSYLVSNKKECNLIVRFTHILSESYSFMYKEKSEKTNRITIEYTPETSTNGNYYVTHMFDYSKEPYRSQCLITCNGFTIIFPLYNYKSVRNRFNYSLEVHHLLYIEGHNPWENENSELITLCENCHNYYHTVFDIPIVSKNEVFPSLNNRFNNQNCMN